MGIKKVSPITNFITINSSTSRMAADLAATIEKEAKNVQANYPRNEMGASKMKKEQAIAIIICNLWIKYDSGLRAQGGREMIDKPVAQDLYPTSARSTQNILTKIISAYNSEESKFSNAPKKIGKQEAMEGLTQYLIETLIGGYNTIEQVALQYLPSPMYDERAVFGGSGRG